LDASIAQKQIDLGMPLAVQMATAPGTTKGDSPIFADTKIGTVPGELAATAHSLAWAAMVDMAVFFVVLLVGFAYVWNQGDLDWVRAIGRQEAPAAPSAQSQSSLVG
jgi:hypothetical protein